MTNAYNPNPGPEPALDPRAYPNRTIALGKLVLTTCTQGAGAPVIDACTTGSVDGWHATGWCIRLRRTRGRALVVAWKGWKGYEQMAFIRRAVNFPVVGRLFRGRFA